MVLDSLRYAIADFKDQVTPIELPHYRTLIIWAVSLGLAWQQFQYLQVIGFILLLVSALSSACVSG